MCLTDEKVVRYSHEENLKSFIYAFNDLTFESFVEKVFLKPLHGLYRSVSLPFGTPDRKYAFFLQFSPPIFEQPFTLKALPSVFEVGQKSLFT